MKNKIIKGNKKPPKQPNIKPTNQPKLQTKPKNKRQNKKPKGKMCGTGIQITDINLFSCKLCKLVSQQ